jgi:hypothetical protein
MNSNAMHLVSNGIYFYLSSIYHMHSSSHKLFILNYIKILSASLYNGIIYNDEQRIEIN